MFSILINGSLANNPMTRSGKTGNYVTARLFARDGEARLHVSLIAFGSAGKRLGEMVEGDALSVAGRAKLTEWEGADGATRRGVSVTVHRLLTMENAERGGDDDEEPPFDPTF